MRSTTETIIIGAGQAGLALSHCLTGAGRDHVAARARADRRALAQRALGLAATPDAELDDPAARRHLRRPRSRRLHDRARVRPFISRDYARDLDAPVETGVTVLPGAARDAVGYRVDTDWAVGSPRNVVIATGQPTYRRCPGVARALPPAAAPDHPSSYRRPAALAPGGVLVVGASASGVQIAQELAAGRPRRHPRGGPPHPDAAALPRPRHHVVARRIGVLDDPIDQVRDPAARSLAPSLQLVGRADHRDLDLGTLPTPASGSSVAPSGSTGHGVHLRRRPGRRRRRRPGGAGTGPGPRRRRRDAVSASTTSRRSPRPPACVPILSPRRRRVDLRAEGIGTVLWATGYRRGPTPGSTCPCSTHRRDRPRRRCHCRTGLFVLGLRFQRADNSNFIDGVGHDALLVAHHICRRNPARVAA